MTSFFKPDVRGYITSVQLPAAAAVTPTVGSGVSRRRRLLRQRQVTVQREQYRELFEALVEWLKVKQDE